MSARPGIFTRRVFLPAGSATALLAMAYVALRVYTAHAMHDLNSDAPPADLLPPFMMFALLIATFAAILTGATYSAVRPDERAYIPTARLYLAWALLANALGVLLLVVALESRTLTVVDALKLYVLLAAWALLCTASAALVAGFGSGPAVVLTATLASILLASPIALFPAIRAIPIAHQSRAVAALALSCPTLAAWQAVLPSHGFTWIQSPLLYHLTALGQDIPLPLPTWWHSAVLFALLALPLGAMGYARRANCER